MAADVRYGSKADIAALPINVRFTPKSGHWHRFWIFLMASGGCSSLWSIAVKLVRRKFLLLTAGATALPVALRFAWAQTYPSRPVRIIVGLAPGGTSDISARLVGQWLSERLGRQFVVENKTGAAGNIAAEYVVNATPDGYMLLVFASPAAINATLYPNLNFNLIHDIAPVASILRVPDVILVNPSFPAKTVPELIAYAKANPGKINMATAGIGTTPHVFGELFKMMAGLAAGALSRWRTGARRSTRRTGSSDV